MEQGRQKRRKKAAAPPPSPPPPPPSVEISAEKVTGGVELDRGDVVDAPGSSGTPRMTPRESQSSE